MYPWPYPGEPCNTILAYPLIWTPDFQPVDAAGDPSWKERVVETSMSVTADIIVNNLWWMDVWKLAFDQVSLGVATSVFTVPWRSAIVKYDDDEVRSGNGILSLFANGVEEREQVVPGTFRSGVFHGTGVASTPPPQKISIKSRAKRRVETGEGLYWIFEVGCANILGTNGNLNQLFDQYNTGPLMLMAHFSVSYVE